MVFLAFFGALLGLLLLTSPDPGPVSRVETPQVGSRISPPAQISELATRLQRIADEHRGYYGAVVLDPETGQRVTMNADESFMAASLAKLPVLLTLYGNAARGEVDLEEEISILPTDVAGYGSGVLHTYPIGYTMTLRECAYYLIKESDNTAWLMLERYLGKEKIENELRILGAEDTSYGTLQTTPADVLLMLRSIADPRFTTPNMSAEMLELMTGTAFEDRLAGPLPDTASVAHKIGSYEGTFSDAGVISYEDPEGATKRYFIVVAAKNATEDAARSAIRSMSLATYRALVDPRAGTQKTTNPRTNP